MVILGIARPAHSNISDLDEIVLINQAVAYGKIPVYDSDRLHELHSRCYLGGHVDQASIAGKSSDKAGFSNDSEIKASVNRCGHVRH